MALGRHAAAPGAGDAVVSRPLAILQVTTFYPPYSFGGDAVYVERLSGLLADAGHDVEVVHCVDAYRLLHPSPPPVPPRPRPGVTVHSLRSRWGRLSPAITHATGGPGVKAARLRSLLAGRRWDVVHFHNISLFGPRVLTLVPRTAETVSLYTLHEHWLICPTHVLWKFNRRPCEKPQCLRCMLLAGRPPQLWRATRLLQRCCERVDRFVAATASVAAMHAERGFPRAMVRLPLFVERADEDWRSPPPRPHDRPYFLFVGRLEAIKGPQTLIEVWRDVTEWDLLLAGTGALEPSLRRDAAANPRIRFLGGLPREQLGAYYANALALIVPSLGHEVFTLVVLEALSRKLPVIARDFASLGEMVAESEGGLLYRDEAGLRAAVARLASAPALRADLGERGYRTFVERWSPEAHLRSYLALLEDTARAKFGRVPWREPVAGRPAP
jgi:glycosyltransferase involved in cell wall biosynthesis